jgi:DNA-directed RNA polymerase specialized sigma24 family protein
VARALGITVAAVRSRTSRGVRQLSALLGGALAVNRVGGWEAAR